jgi:hypothetical protein
VTEQERRWYTERLDDPSLLDHAVVIGEPSFRGLAVPVGGRRRAGFVCVDGAVEAAEVMALLARAPGFPNLRAVLSGDPEVSDSVRWGEDEPPIPAVDASDVAWARSEAATGRLYGYSERAIRDHVTRLWGKLMATRAVR